MSNESCVVLLVDDDVLVRNLARRNLEAAGFTVLSAADGDEATALSRSCAERIVAAVVDVEMPGIDGVTVAGAILHERPDMAVLLMSGGTSRPIPAHMYFIAKPFLPSELTTTLMKILERHRDRMTVEDAGTRQALDHERPTPS